MHNFNLCSLLNNILLTVSYSTTQKIQGCLVALVCSHCLPRTLLGAPPPIARTMSVCLSRRLSALGDYLSRKAPLCYRPMFRCILVQKSYAWKLIKNEYDVFIALRKLRRKHFTCFILTLNDFEQMSSKQLQPGRVGHCC